MTEGLITDEGVSTTRHVSYQGLDNEPDDDTFDLLLNNAYNQ